MTNRIAKFGAVLAGGAMALSFALPVGAVTVAELQAQINALMAQLASLQGGSATGGAVQFNTNLTVGSTGADVTALQQFLVSKGFLQMPVNVSYGYFGPITRAAVAAWQAANGIAPAVGYFGPISRAAIASMTPSTGGTIGGTTVVCPVGYTCTSTGGTVTGGITTPGVEGTLTVTSAPVSSSTLYEGDMMKEILAFKVRAQTSDIAVQRVKLDLGNSTTIYNKIYQRVYVVDESGRTLASSDLNSNTVVKDGSNYYITLAGFSYVIPKDTTVVLSIKADVRPSIDSTDLATPRTVSLANSGVRGTDGAGIDQYSPLSGSSISKTISFSTSLIEAASLTLSTDINNPLTQEVIAADGVNNNELDKATLLIFDIKAEKDNVLLTDLVATVTRTGGAATASSTFLYVDGNQIGSASFSTSTATFSDIDYTIPKGVTKVFSLKADIRGATSVQTTFGANVQNADLTAENSIGDSVINKSGSATANALLVRNAGPVFSLSGDPTIMKSATPVQNNNSTSTASGTFNLRIRAVGSAISFGSNASATPLVSNAVTSARSFMIYAGGATSNPAVASSTSFTVPSSGVINNSPVANSFTLQEDNEIMIPVTFLFEGRFANSSAVDTGSYSIALERINWADAGGVANSSTFMAGLTQWRTGSVSLP